MVDPREMAIDLAAEDKALAQHIHPLAGWEQHRAFRLGYRAGFAAGLAHAPTAPDPATVAMATEAFVCACGTPAIYGRRAGPYQPLEAFCRSCWDEREKGR